MRNIYEPVIRKIMNIKQHGSRTNVSIANYLVDRFNTQVELPKITQLAESLGVSTAAISKFVKMIGLDNYSILRFIFISSLEEKEMKKEDEAIEITNAAKLIQDSNRIVLIGEGASASTNFAFHMNLEKFGYHSIWSAAPGDQKWFTDRLSSTDSIIITSVSMDKGWIEDMIKTTKAKIILITAAEYNNKKVDVKLSVNVDERVLGNELSYRARMWTLAIFNSISDALEDVWE